MQALPVENKVCDRALQCTDDRASGSDAEAVLVSACIASAVEEPARQTYNNGRASKHGGRENSREK